MISKAQGRVVEVSGCDLFLGNKPWAFAAANAAAIDTHWAKRSAESAAFFNGRVLMMADYAIESGTLSAEFFEAEFKSFLYWREMGQKPGQGIIDGFGSALIKSSDGAVLLGLQTAGNINAGLAYLPGGFIDKRDVHEKGGRRVIDISASIAREIAEETGLGPSVLTPRPGYLVTILDTQVSIAAPYASHLTAAQLREHARAHMASETDPELADMVIVRNARDLEQHAVPDYAAVLLRHLFTGAGR